MPTSPLTKPAPSSTAFEPATFAFVDGLPWPAILIDEAGEVVHVNAPMKNASVEQAVIGARHLRQAFADYYAALIGDAPWLTPQTTTVLRALPNGEQRFEQISLCRLPAGACLIVMDQTAHRELEVGHAQTVRLASLGFMLASVSHEVSNPLTAIHSMVQILQSKRGVTPSALQQGLQNIATSVRRILSITRKLNVFSRVDDEPKTAFAVDSAIDEAVVLFGYDSLGESVQVSHQHHTAAIVTGFPEQLQQVFFNILLNAAQAMKGKGAITIATRLSDAEHVEVTIRDTGPGLPGDHLQKIFEPFFTTKRGGEGTGLGLAISNEIVHEHGGTIWVENHPDGGACFHIRLPLARERNLN